jgi:hypothetical protein
LSVHGFTLFVLFHTLNMLNLSLLKVISTANSPVTPS